jgi:hypothetical protein
LDSGPVYVRAWTGYEGAVVYVAVEAGHVSRIGSVGGGIAGGGIEFDLIESGSNV